MSSQTDTYIERIILIAREEKRSPLGIPQNSERNTGFASVFLHLTNPQNEKINLLIKNIKIINFVDDRPQDFNWSTQEINLNPLENSEVVFELANKTGYIGQDRVKAIVVYQIGDKIHSVESEPVEIKRR